MLKRQIIALVAALAAGSAQAAPLVFDPTGADAGGAYTVDSLDWSPSAVLAVNGNQAIANFLNGSGSTTFQVLSSVSLSSGSLTGPGTQFAILGSTPYEITAVLGYSETITGVTVNPDGTASADFSFAAGQPTFANIYYGAQAASSYALAAAAKDANQLQGTGYDNGLLIYSSTLTTTDGSFGTSLSSPCSPNSPTTNLDANGNGNQWNTQSGGTPQQTVCGNGSNADLVLTAGAPTSINTDFFQNTPLISWVITNVSLIDPFTGQADPAFNFVQTPGGALYNVSSSASNTSTLGLVNGGIDCSTGTCIPSGADFMFSTDVNSSVQATIPEPGTLALLGIGLAGLGFGVRRRRI